MSKKFWLAGVGLALLYSIWLSMGSWNLGSTIINSLFLVLTAAYFKEIRKNNFLKMMWGLSLALGIMMMVRSNEMVKELTVVTIIILNVTMAAMAKVAAVKLDVGKVILTQVGMIGEFFGLIKLVRWDQKYDNKTIKKIIIGVVLAIPLLLVFGSLFYSADPIFAKLVNQIGWPRIQINTQIMWRIISSGVFFGALLAAWKIKIAENNFSLKLKKWTEINIAVAILEILIAIFCVIQIKYFWAGPEEFRRLGIIFSEYTRNGYNQMIIASILAYGIITMLRINSFLTWSMVVEILILIASATKRNYIYQSVYGFTEVRLMGVFLSGWLMAMVVLVGYKILKNKSDDFQTRAIILISAITILALNLFNIDGVIVKNRPANYDWGIDYQYMVGLSDDGYEGHEKVLTELESRVKNNQIENLQQKDEAKYLVDRLQWNYLRDQKEAQNSWNRLGNWNYSTNRSLQYFNQNQKRIKIVEEQINKIEINLKEKGSSAAKEEIKKVVEEMANGIKKIDPKATVKEIAAGNNSDFTVRLVVEIQTDNVEKTKTLIPASCWIKTTNDKWLVVECQQTIR